MQEVEQTTIVLTQNHTECRNAVRIWKEINQDGRNGKAVARGAITDHSLIYKSTLDNHVPNNDAHKGK